MLPVKYLDDLKSAPIDEVDFVATFIEVCPTQIHKIKGYSKLTLRRCSRANTPQWGADLRYIRV